MISPSRQNRSGECNNSPESRNPARAFRDEEVSISAAGCTSVFYRSSQVHIPEAKLYEKQ